MSEKTKDPIWNATINEIKRGYIETKGHIQCLVCEETFTIGRIYNINGEFYDAKKAAELHIEDKHNSMLNYILNMNSTFTGISDIQKQLISMFIEGLSDKEISDRLGIAQSTIRNHRYKLREKEKQGKLFVAMMELLKDNTKKTINKLDEGTLSDAHKTATTLDDRFNITDEEKEKVLRTHMDEAGALKTYPIKEKKKIIVLEEIIKSFKRDIPYTEKEVNKILGRIYEDYATIRRALTEYGFLERTRDGSTYRVKE